MTGPHRFTEEEQAYEQRQETILPALRYLINNDPFSIPHRLQQLMFYAEVIYYRDYEKRLTQARYEPNMRGTYSRDISNALEALANTDSTDIKHTLHDGDRTKRFQHVEYNDGLTYQQEHFLDTIIEETEVKDTQELTGWVEETDLFNNTGFDDIIDITAVRRPAVER